MYGKHKLNKSHVIYLPFHLTSFIIIFLLSRFSLNTDGDYKSQIQLYKNEKFTIYDCPFEASFDLLERF